MMPEDLSNSSEYTLYWVWQWPTSPGTPGVPDGKDEYYTTCSDVDVIPHIDHVEASNPLQHQDPQRFAVGDYVDRAQGMD
jgi:hypothetical protein